MLSTCKNLDGYLTRYGKILGKQSLDLLKPLHTPGEDPPCDTDQFIRKPFDPQAHVIASASKMLQTSKCGFIVGEMGCIAGESEIYDPVQGKMLRVDQITEPFHVTSYNEEKESSVIGNAHVPFIKGTKELYRVQLEFGKSFLCTHDHLVLTRFGWRRIDQMVVNDSDYSIKAITTAAGVCAAGWEKAVSITYERTDIYYDFTVDEYHNYVMAGVVHHNTGKTLLAMGTAHVHAQGKKYRALVMCPDHLIDKWEEEIQETIPGVDIHKFDNWKSCLKFFSHKYTANRKVAGQPRLKAKMVEVSTGVDEVEVRQEAAGEPMVQQERAHWRTPERPIWVIVGRNQSKWNPDWNPVGCSEDTKINRMIERRIITGEEIKTDANGDIVRDLNGRAMNRKKTTKAACCPRCGSPIRNKEGMPIGLADIAEKQSECKAWFLEQISGESPDAHPNGKYEAKNGEWKVQGLDHIYATTKDSNGYNYIDRYMDNAKEGKIVSVGGRKYRMGICKEPLWQWTRQPYRWPPAKIIQKQMRGFFDYMICDEVHEEKGQESAQSMAAGKLIASSKHMIALTGTLIGGYAHHLFPLLVRMCPQGIVRDEGFKWGQTVAFAQKYGRVDTIITQKIGGDDDTGTTIGRRQSAMGRVRAGNNKENKRVRIAPGVMPHLFGRHLIGSSVFLSLEDMDETLPRLIDYEIEEKQDVEFPGAGPHALEMDDELEREYKRIEKILEEENKALLKTGSMKLLGATLHTLLDYPDRPYDWPGRYPAGTYGVSTYESPSYAVGYHTDPKNKTRQTWVNVVQPGDLPSDAMRYKEAKLLQICLQAKRKGYQSWVYFQMTGKRDVQPRIKALLESQGLTVEILRSTTVNLRDRLAWIKKVGPTVDVMLSHPKLVETGLDLFAKDGKHNFNNIIFYETGYNLFTLRQAARRAWRISQKRDCMVHYLFYKGTMQERAMALMGRKLQAAESVDGKFSTEGLIAMAGEESAQLALARSLSEKIEDQRRAWNRFGDQTKRAVIKAFTTMQEVLAGHEDVELILGETLIPEAFGEAVADVLQFPGATESVSQSELDEADSLMAGLDFEDIDEMFAMFANSGIDLSTLTI